MSGALVTAEILAAACAAAGLPEGAPATPGPGPLASPSYKALESASVIVAAPGGAVFVKVMHPEMRAGFDLAAAMQLARQAGEIGVGPKVIWTDAAQGAIAMEALGPEAGWRTANQATLQDAGVVAAAMAALRALHGTAPLAARFDPFAGIDRLIANLGRIGAPLPEDIGWLRATIALCEPMMEGVALKPCRNDGSASNLLVGPGLRLIDYDRAGMMDPLYEVGALLAEVTDFEADMQPGFAAYNGGPDPVAFTRARLWSFVDDMLHALWSRFHAHHSVRGGVEWLKYGEWRLMRLRLALNHPGFEEKIRIVRGQA